MTSIGNLTVENSLIPFTDGYENFLLVGVLGLTVFGLLAGLIIMISCIQREMNPSTLLLLSLCFADFLFLISVTSHTIICLKYQAYVTSSIACLTNATVNCFANLISICSLLSITFERCIGSFANCRFIDCTCKYAFNKDGIHLDSNNVGCGYSVCVLSIRVSKSTSSLCMGTRFDW